MLETCGLSSLSALTDAAIPDDIRVAQSLRLPASRSEQGLLAELKTLADKNRVYRSFIGMGYYNCITPGVIQRNILEDRKSVV